MRYLVKDCKDKVAVIDVLRTPFVKSFGVFENESALSLSVKIVQEMVSRYFVHTTDIDECIWGVVVPQVKCANLAREIILFSGLPKSIPGFTLNKACDSSLQSIEIACDRISLGKNKLVLAGGVEVLSDIPLPFSDEARRFFLKLSKAKSIGEKLSLLSGINLKWFLPSPPTISEPFTGLTMGEHSELMAVKNKISRESQDVFSLNSHLNAAKAHHGKLFQEEIVPIWTGKSKEIFVDNDNNVRPDCTLEALSKLKPVFDKKNGTITAGNSSPLTDGASCALLSSETYAKEKGLPILGYVLDVMTVAVDPQDQLLIGPAYIIPKLLAKNNISKDDVGVYEIHEAFASQVLSCLEAMSDQKFCQEKLGLKNAFGAIPMTKINIRGGSIAIGHPFGATGARLVGNALRIAKEQGSRYAIVAVCAAGGMGMGILLETRGDEL